MKFRIFAVLLFPALLCLAQSNNQTNSNNSATQAQASEGCAGSCCKAMAENKDAKPCCHHDSTAKDAAEPCCSRKDNAGNEAMSCMKGKASAESGAGNCCGGNHEKGCSAKSEKEPQQTAMSCCAGSAGHCGMQHHEHDDVGK